MKQGMIWHLQTLGQRQVYRGWPQGGRWQYLLKIVIHRDRPAEVRIWNPPPGLRETARHGACWQLLHPHCRWFQLHWVIAPWDFESARQYLEEMLGAE